MDAKRIKHMYQWSFMKATFSDENSIVVTVTVNIATLTFLQNTALTQSLFQIPVPNKALSKYL